MHDDCETVKIKADNDQGFIIINESDYDSAVHELFVEGEKPKRVSRTKSE